MSANRRNVSCKEDNTKNKHHRQSEEPHSPVENKAITINDDNVERRHFLKILRAFKSYRSHSLKRLATWERSFNELPDAHRQMLPAYREHLDEIHTCIDRNYAVVRQIVDNADHMFVNADHSRTDDFSTPSTASSDMDMDKVRTTLRQFVRDWSEEGAQERLQSYQPVINDIVERFPPDKCNASGVAVLVPGAGLGRLTFEIARRGYKCQGNEWSLFMLFASNFILNSCHQVNGYCLYPWIHQSCNNRTNSDRVRAVRFPDVNPSDLPEGSEFSMAAGDFLEIYQEADNWDCVATVFFIDTAHNIISYIQTIFNILRPGGYWMNLGPLLYHYADIKGESSIELSYEDVRRIMIQIGFVIEKEVLSVKCGYTQNVQSMLKYEYDSVYFVCQKPGGCDPSSSSSLSCDETVHKCDTCGTPCPRTEDVS